MEDEFEQMKLEIQRLKEDALQQQSEWDEKEAIRKETRRQEEEEKRVAQQEVRRAAEKEAKRAEKEAKRATEEEARQEELRLAAEEGAETESSIEAENQQAMEAIWRLEEELGFRESEGGLPPLTQILNEDILAKEKKARRDHETQLQSKVYEQKIDNNGISFGLGRRKSSTAQVWIREIEDHDDWEFPEYGFMVNGKEAYEYFPMFNHRYRIMEPLAWTGSVGAFHVEVKNYYPEFRPQLKKHGLMTRDPRMVERKKPGRPKARKSFQWVKR
eukprot:gene14764-17442_t